MKNFIAIKAENVTKIYSDGYEAVKGLNLEVKKGEIFGFLGPNGAGKSTSIKMFTGSLRLSSGKLTVLGYDLPKERNKLKKRIGYVPQDLVFYSHLTVRENLMLLAACYEVKNQKERVNYILSTMQIDKLAKRKASLLSGGEKRRLNVALGLINSPSVLFLDEPSAGMDPKSRNILWNIISKISEEEKITIILTTHLIETAERLSDRIAIINNGSVQIIGKPSELKERHGKSEVIDIKLSERVNVGEAMKSLSKYSTMRIGTRIRVNTENAIKELPLILALLTERFGKENVLDICHP